MGRELAAVSQAAALSSLLGLGACASTPSAQTLFRTADCAELGDDRVLALSSIQFNSGGGSARVRRVFPTTDPNYAALLRLVGEIKPGERKPLGRSNCGPDFLPLPLDYPAIEGPI